MEGISSKAAGDLENKKKYNGYEFNNDFDINLYESFYRSHDPQIGRFWQPDPKPNALESLYAAMGNNPALNFDILGDTLGPKAGVDFSAVKLPKYEYVDYKQGRLINLLGNAEAIGSNAGINLWNSTVGFAEDATNLAVSTQSRLEVLTRYATSFYNIIEASGSLNSKIANGQITRESLWNGIQKLFTTPEGLEQVSTMALAIAIPGGFRTALGRLTPEARAIFELLIGGSEERSAVKGGAYVTENLAGFYVRGSTSVANGIYTRTIQSLANMGNKSLFDLMKVFESEARAAGAGKIIINGIDIVETRLINEGAARLLGYSLKQTSNNSIQLTKILK